MSDKTTNYGLTKPLQTEYYDIEIQNGNMEIIDDQLKTLDNGKESLIKDAASKTSLADADAIHLTDSAASNVTKKITFTNIKTVLKTYFDTLYNKYTHPTYTANSSGLYKVTVDGTGHVSAATSVAKTDITALGIPAQDTVTAVVDNLTSTDTAKALSANQGKMLNDLVSTKVPNTRTVNGKALNTDIVLTASDLGDSPTDSYMAFCGNINGNILDAAFGKNNQDAITGIGRQLAMYAWFKEANKVAQPFTKLINCKTWDDCIANAFDEILVNTDLMALYQNSPYAASRVDVNAIMGTFKDDYAIMTKIMSTPTLIDYIRDNTTWHNGLHNNRTLLETVGSGTYTVPADIHLLTVVCIGGGGNSVAYAGAGGGYVQGLMQVIPGQQITYTVGGSAANTVFGSFTATGASGTAGAASNATAGLSPTQSGKLIKVSSGGGYQSQGRGGGGGYGGGSSTYDSNGSQDIGLGGAGGTLLISGSVTGKGGGGYGGGAGGSGNSNYTNSANGGQGIIALFHK